MKDFIRYNYHHLLLWVTYILVVAVMQYYYPYPNISWDTEYYLQYSRTGMAGIRPEGYNDFLRLLYHWSESLVFVAYIQFALYFLSILALLQVFSKIFMLGKGIYIITGLLMLLEPVCIYHCIAVYSDLYFSALTYFYIATLLYFTYSHKWVYLAVHLMFLYLCLDTRFISLFFPVFSILCILITMRGIFVKLVCALAVFGVFNKSYHYYVNLNTKAFGVPIHSAFAGWTIANNVMFALPRIHLDPKFIEDPHIREVHKRLTDHINNSTYVVYNINTDYMWDGRSPLAAISAEVYDSLKNSTGVEPLPFQDMYIVAPRFGAYGKYIQTHYPYEFFMGYMVPNAKTLMDPADGEMGDYYMHTDLSDMSMVRYHVLPSDIQCRRDIYKEVLSVFIHRLYKCKLLLFCIACIGIVLIRKKIKRQYLYTLGITASFVILFYLATLYSSWFMFRYTMPVLPLMTAAVVLTGRSFLMNRKQFKK